MVMHFLNKSINIDSQFMDSYNEECAARLRDSSELNDGWIDGWLIQCLQQHLGGFNAMSPPA